MSEHNYLAYGTTLSQAAGVAGGLADGQDGMGRLGETLQPVLDIWNRPEHRILRGEITFARRMNSAAVAARFSALEFVNPSDSTKLAVITAISGEDYPQAYDLVVDSGAALGATATQRGVAADTRYRLLGEASICTIVSGDFAAGASLPQWRTASGSAPVPFVGVPFVIAPGFKLFIMGTVVNTAVRASLCWTERQAMPGELQSRG